MSTIFINGAGGFVGSHLVKRFLAKDYQVIASDVPGANLTWAEQEGAKLHFAFIDDSPSHQEILKGVDYVIHVAGHFRFDLSEAEMRKVNTEGVRTICQAALENSIRKLVIISTVASYGVLSKIPADEDAPKKANTIYGRTKYGGELTAMDFHKRDGLPVAAIRPTLVYGPGNRFGLANFDALLTLMKARGTRAMYLVKGGPLTHFVHIDDVVQGIEVILESPDTAGKSYNVADACPLRLEEAFRILMNYIGLEGKTVVPYVPFLWTLSLDFLYRASGYWINRENGRIEKSWERFCDKYNLKTPLSPRLDPDWMAFMEKDISFDTGRLKALGFKPKHPSFKESYPQVAEWYREQGWLPKEL